MRPAVVNTDLCVTGVDHVGIVVSDAAPVVTLLSMLPGVVVGAPVEHPELGLLIQFVALGELRLELLTPTDPSSRAAALIATGRSGVHHLALTTSDLPAALRALRSAGIPLADQTGRPGAHGSTIAFIDADALSGVSIELVQPATRQESIHAEDPSRNG